MKRFFCIILSFLGTIFYAQENINSDRPDHSEGTYTMPKNKWQIEGGFSFSKSQVSDNLMIRYGIRNGTELRLETDFSKNKGEKFNFDDVIFSAKHRLSEEKNGLPTITLVGYLGYLSENQWKYDAYIAFENTLSEKFALDYNIGSSDSFKTLDFTTEFIYTPTEKFNIFVEYYTHFNKSKPSHNIDFGAMYAIKPNFQIDFVLGKGIANGDDFFTSVGVSYRLD